MLEHYPEKSRNAALQVIATLLSAEVHRCQVKISGNSVHWNIKCIVAIDMQGICKVFAFLLMFYSDPRSRCNYCEVISC